MKRILSLIGLVCLIFLGIHLFIEPLYTPTAISTPAHHAYFPKYIAHKAIISDDYHGNTLGAVAEVLASYADGLEIDVRLSRDQIPFLYHGDTLDESTTGKGVPEDFTWKELRNIFYRDGNQSKIASLEEVFQLVGSQKNIIIDIKTNKLLNGVFAEKIAGLIKKYHLQESVIVESFNPFFLAAMRFAARDVLLMYDFTINAKAIGEEKQSQFDQIPWLLKQPFIQKQIRRIVRPDVLGPRWNLDEDSLKSLITHGYPVIAWTVDSPKVAQKLFKMGVKGVQTNKVSEIMASTSSGLQSVYDAGGSTSNLQKIVHVKNAKDVVQAIFDAKAAKKKITIAGRRHSMGGQTLLDDSIQLDMMGLNYVHYNPKTQTVTVGSGATWKKVMDVLDQCGRSIKVMQSDNIFTAGGSISVNVHGWQVSEPPIASTVLSLKVITADGKMHTLSKEQEPELFAAVIGGYGLLGAIIEAELATTANSNLKFHADYIKPEQFTEKFAELVTKNPNVELAYGRLSVDENHLFEEAGLFWYEKIGDQSEQSLKPESLVALKRAIFRLSEYTELGKKIRWSAEKQYAKKLIDSPSMSRNSAMNTDIHILWPLYGKNKDILHEYFIPKDHLNDFLIALKHHILANKMNILNVTIREVRKDTISLIPYATEDMFGLVLLFSQGNEPEDEKAMMEFTQKIIDESLKLNGTFYLPYRLHYNREQLIKAYPTIHRWLNLKKQWDPESTFSSQFFNYLKSLPS